uniref:2,3-bisphosphoglycerate-independent phosphoglycerate mutase n=1 Tax=Calliarthron tuberculosum TaxID=48942 RepID=M4IU95_CALTB|nr:phosphoglycerate mutase [Calliarthron tuberculosum]AGA63928.1 phosphoglycerate mutase [Calliarthron tuberculosum]
MQNTQIIKPIILLILDGLGYNHKYHGNAIKQAYTPNLDFLWHHYPKTLIHASGEYVGLPKGQMGNSEVGHTTIGAGRIINQALVKINKSIETGAFFNNINLSNIYTTINNTTNKIHLIGLCSDGGVHSHINHLFALIEISKKYKDLQTCIHIITDGRDTKPNNAQTFINQVETFIKDSLNIKISTVSGRYYSMDRDCRWNRTEEAYLCLTNDNNIQPKYFNKSHKLINHNYNQEIYDEFIKPTRINYGKIEEGDGIIFFNFRPDRMRQLVQAFVKPYFKGFKVHKFAKLNIATFSTYDSTLNLPVIFPKIAQNNFLGKIISDNGLKQFRLAETEKYAHVTYFFNGGREEPFPGEDRQLIQSPQVDIYDSTPEMSAEQITEKLIQALKKNIYHLLIVNYANPDMLGHTGNFLATKKAIELLDKNLNKLLYQAKQHNAILIITADHGNAEKMLDKKNQPCKSHTNNLVPFIIVNNQNIYLQNKNNNKTLKPIGSLADIAPSILNLLKIDIPKDMDGQSLINDIYLQYIS